MLTIKEYFMQQKDVNPFVKKLLEEEEENDCDNIILNDA